MTISENELRDILKIQRQLVRVLENALKSEQEKNEERLKRQLEASGIDVEYDTVEFIDDCEGSIYTCDCDTLLPHEKTCQYYRDSTDAFEL